MHIRVAAVVVARYFIATCRHVAATWPWKTLQVDILSQRPQQLVGTSTFCHIYLFPYAFFCDFLLNFYRFNVVLRRKGVAVKSFLRLLFVPVIYGVYVVFLFVFIFLFCTQHVATLCKCIFNLCLSGVRVFACMCRCVCVCVAHCCGHQSLCNKYA